MGFRSSGDRWIEAGARIGNLDDEPIVGPRDCDRRRRAVSVSPSVVQRLLDNPVESDLCGQRRLRGKIALDDLGRQTGSSLMAAHDMLERLLNS
jgi:hypothetical protein